SSVPSHHPTHYTTIFRPAVHDRDALGVRAHDGVRLGADDDRRSRDAVAREVVQHDHAQLVGEGAAAEAAAEPVVAVSVGEPVERSEEHSLKSSHVKISYT